MCNRIEGSRARLLRSAAYPWDEAWIAILRTGFLRPVAFIFAWNLRVLAQGLADVELLHQNVGHHGEREAEDQTEGAEQDAADEDGEERKGRRDADHASGHQREDHVALDLLDGQHGDDGPESGLSADAEGDQNRR